MTQREAFEAWWGWWGQAPVELQPLQPRTREDTLSAWVWEAWQAAQAAQPAQVPAWQPIETAPEDGSVFLVGNIGAGKQLHWTRAAVRGRMPLAKVFYTPLGESINAPTHWALLPAAPEVKS